MYTRYFHIRYRNRSYLLIIYWISIEWSNQTIFQTRFFYNCLLLNNKIACIFGAINVIHFKYKSENYLVCKWCLLQLLPVVLGMHQDASRCIINAGYLIFIIAQTEQSPVFSHAMRTMHLQSIHFKRLLARMCVQASLRNANSQSTLF